MIEVENLTKRYGDRLAVDGLSFIAPPGSVTGFLGPNGAGKSTTMRMIAGLDRPTAGSVRVNGRRYADCPAPMTELGSLLEARAVHTGRSARNHLLALAQTAGLGRRRVEEVIELVGLRDVARRRAGRFSLGMGQRLGIAAALLGDPRTLVLDEPVNGLDPDGVRWVRTMLRRMADDGHTVFVSSHLMAEMAQTADRLVVVGRGRLIADCTVAEFVARTTTHEVRVRTPRAGALRSALSGTTLSGTDVIISSDGDDVLTVRGLTSDRIGDAACAAGLPVHELSTVTASLEDAFMSATRDAVEYGSAQRDSTTLTDAVAMDPARTDTALPEEALR